MTSSECFVPAYASPTAEHAGSHSFYTICSLETLLDCASTYCRSTDKSVITGRQRTLGKVPYDAIERKLSTDDLQLAAIINGNPSDTIACQDTSILWYLIIDMSSEVVSLVLSHARFSKKQK